MTHQVAWRFTATERARFTSWLESQRDDGRRILDASTRTLLDIYLETEDWRLLRAGWALRLRRTTTHAPAATQYEACLEPLLPDVAAFTAPLADAQPATVRQVPGELGDRVRLIAGRRPLHALCEAHARREIYLIEEHGEILAAVNVDTIGAAPGLEPGSELVHRIEVQVRPADRGRLQDFVDEMQRVGALQSEVVLPFEHALAARHIEPLKSLALGSTAIQPQLPIAAAAYAILRTHFAALWKHEPGTRLGEDIEALHQMRVATRRLRAGLKLFEDVLPPRRQAWLSEELGWLGAALGRVRDLDVLRANLRQYSLTLPEADGEALHPIMARFEARRAASQEQLLQDLDSERYERLIKVGTLTLQRGIAPRTRAARMIVAASAPRRIARRRRVASKHAARLDATSAAPQLHALRIRCKRLRYAVDFFADVYARPAKNFSQDLAAIQDGLGLQQDAAFVTSLRPEMVTGEDITPAALAAFDAFVQDSDRRAAAERLHLEELLRALDGKPWKRLRRAMRRCRKETLRATAPKAKRQSRRSATTVPPATGIEAQPPSNTELSGPTTRVQSEAIDPVDAVTAPEAAPES